MSETIQPITTFIPNFGAVVLCGGKSARMGTRKESLLLRGRTLMDHVLQTVASVTNTVTVVGSDADQRQPQRPQVVYKLDENLNCGPLEGIRVGLKTLSSTVEWAFVTSCDAPLIRPALIRHLAQLIGNHQAVIPIVGKSPGERIYGMTAVYRTDIADEIGRMIDGNELRVKALATRLNALLVDVESLRTVDPQLESLRNINTPAEYQDLVNGY